MPYNPTDTVTSVLASLDTRATNLEAVNNLPLKIILEGDSISAYSYSMTNAWMENNLSVEAVNLSVAGAHIGPASGFATNTLTARLPDLYSEASGFDVILAFMVTNDLTSQTVAEYQQRLTDYITTVRANVSGIKIGVGTLVPGGTVDYSAYNAKRITLNAWLRTQVGGLIDFLIPYGEHPLMGVDSSADGELYPDRRHPSSGGHGYLRSVLAAVLDPIVAGATGATPNPFTLADRNAADPSTEYTTQVTVSGMGIGQSATASISGSGDFKRGTDAYGTSSVPMMNGDISTVRDTSSGTDGDTSQTTHTIGPHSDTWDITTAISAAVGVWDQAWSDPALSFPSARKVIGPANGQSGYNTNNGARTDVGHADGNYAAAFALGPESGGSTYKIGLAGIGFDRNQKMGSTSGSASRAGITYESGGKILVDGVETTGFPTFGAGDIVLMCVKIQNSIAKIWFLNFNSGTGAWDSIDGDPTADTGGFTATPASAEWFAAVNCQRNEGVEVNCGQDPFPAPLPAGFTQWG